MARNRTRKSDKGMFLQDDMREAVKLVMSGKYSYRRAAQIKHVDYRTLYRYNN